jgi:acetyl esterase/lipase
MHLQHVRRQTPQLLLGLVNRTARLLFRRASAAMVRGEPGPMRRQADFMGNKLAAGVQRQDGQLAGMGTAWFVPTQLRDDIIILYAHGGGLAVGSCDSHASICSILAATARRKVLVFNYRLTPEHAWPAAAEDALAIYGALLQQGQGAENIVLAGDSAGGTLTLALLLDIRDKGLPLPRAAIANCPWFDFESRSASLNNPGDPFLTRPLMHAFAEAALPTTAQRRRHSLTYRDYAGLPPIYLLIGGKDPLYDEDLLLAEKLHEADNKGRAEVWEDMPHVWQGLTPFLTEATLVSERMAEFIDHCGAGA